MKYKWCERSGVIDENGRQVQQLFLTTTKKMRRECGKVLVDFLNGQNTESKTNEASAQTKKTKTNINPGSQRKQHTITTTQSRSF